LRYAYRKIIDRPVAMQTLSNRLRVPSACSININGLKLSHVSRHVLW